MVKQILVRDSETHSEGWEDIDSFFFLKKNAGKPGETLMLNAQGKVEQGNISTDKV